MKPWLKKQPPPPAPAPAVPTPAPAASPSGDGYGAMIAALRQEVDGLRKTTDTLDALYKAQTGRLTELEADLEKTRVEVTALYDSVRALSVRVTTLETPPAKEQWDETHPPEPYPGTVRSTSKGSGKKPTKAK